MRTIISVLSVVILLFTAISLPAGNVSAGIFEEKYGLKPAAIVIAEGDRATYLEARKVIEGIDAKGLIHMPPSFIFAYFPSEFTGAELQGLGVHVITSASEAVPGMMDEVTRRAVSALFDQRRIIEKSPRIEQDQMPMEHFMPGIPEETLIKYGGTAGPQVGSPSEILNRGIQQNAEFLIGKVLVNVIFPESAGSSENWTDEEIGAALEAISIGLSQYEQATHWVDLEFFVHCPQDFRRVPVSIEPIEGNWDFDPYWINECLAYLDILEYFDADQGTGPVGNTHLLNNATRETWGTDWVFTSYMTDASNAGCWGSCYDEDPGTSCYVAYTVSLGGPYQVVPYPACRFGTGIGFSHVFIHEMSHVFWSLDEYASAAALCSDRSGYLNYTNENSYFVPMGANEPCGYQLDCIMNNYELTEPLPICPWTMGQVGLGDDNENSIPDVYDIPPYIEMIEMPGVSSDTTFDGSYILGADANNAAVPNRNPFQNPATRVDYAPWLKRGWIQINSALREEILPGDGRWDESHESLSFFLQEGLDPGDNTIYFIVENCVGMQATATIGVTYIGMKFYQVNTESGSEYIDLSWITASQVFGAQFEIMREDATEGAGFELIATVDGNDPHSGGGTRNYYLFRDEDVKPVHLYNYKIVSRIVAIVDGEEEEFVIESDQYPAKSLIPVVSGIMSPVAPNPFDFSTTAQVEWTVKLPGEFDDLSSTGGGRSMQAATAADEKIMLEVDIYNINGQRVRHLYALPVYGGRYKDMVWDGTNDRGQKVSNGIYFIKVRAGSEETVKKVVVLR